MICIPKCPPEGPSVMTDSSPWIDSLAAAGAELAPIFTEYTPLVDVVSQHADQLPSNMSGLDAKLNALSQVWKASMSPASPEHAVSTSNAFWQQGKESLRVPVLGAAAVVNDTGEVATSNTFVIGGESLNLPLNEVQVFQGNEPAATTYTLLQNRSQHAAALAADKAIVVCGGRNATVSGDSQSRRPALKVR